MASVIIVAKSVLGSCPTAFQEYVRDYFQETEIAGVPCWYTATHVTTPRDGYRRGNAPSHSQNLRMYRAGLEDELSLNEWLRQAAKDKIITQLYAADADVGTAFLED